MAASFSVNTLQVDFESVLGMEHFGMVRMFKTLENTVLKGFFNATGSVYEAAVVEFFANAKVIAGTIVSSVTNRKVALTKEIFAKAFGLPTEGATSFLDVPKETVMEMRNSSEVADMDHQGPNTSNLQMVVYTGEREENTCIYFEEDADSSHAGSQQVFVSSPPACHDADIKLEEHDFGTYKRAIYAKMGTVAANVVSSQTSLETSLVRQFTEHQLQIASEPDYVKLQLEELVNHLKELGDARKGEGGQSGRPGEGPSRQGEGPSSTMDKGPNYRRGEGSSSYKRSRWF
ncbi:hypothetical protein F511_13409 [Dorcoceras hygrometricum]|uniref:Mucin-2-like n=1 Tax=Dorcoceras hygrometricum TaxID=472368 RepID=A0A2Z7DCY5_9LAMI|nr:hypothetical protein F511_13409 [Dorcoceras hygrometricum]